MKNLLIVTQKVDKNDSVLGFFHEWINEFAKQYDSVIVVCLWRGNYSLPKNVKVLSLGKEEGVSKFTYVLRFYKYIWQERKNYQSVFVHMNQEYVLLAGVFWRILKTPVYFWRNHSYGNFLTRIAVVLSNRVFCTSSQSFTARFKKSILMPAGVDTSVFISDGEVERRLRHVCMVGRVSPVKHVFEAVEAVKKSLDDGKEFYLGVFGPVLKEDLIYFDKIKKYVSQNDLGRLVSFNGSLNQKELPSIYSSFEVCLNLTESGSFDKTIVESAGCGTIPLVSNTSLSGSLPKECFVGFSKEEICEGLEKIFNLNNREEVLRSLQVFSKKNSLDFLMSRLSEVMS